MEYKTNAPKGRDLLNERNPGWFRDFDLTNFRIHDIWNCVLGKVYGVYGEGLNALFGADFSDTEDPFHFGKAQAYGFNSCGFNGDRLQKEWVYIITELNDIPGESAEES